MRTARTRRYRRDMTTLNDLSLTPLVDTALTLLIIFMVATPMLQNSIRVTLPHGQAQEANIDKRDLVVYIDARGTIFFNDKPMTVEQLITNVQHELSLHHVVSDQQTLFIKADAAVGYGTVIELVDKLKVVGGIKYVALATTNSTQ